MSWCRRFEVLGITSAALVLGACVLPSQEVLPVAVPPLQLSPGEQLGVDRVVILTDASSSMFRQNRVQARALTLAVISGLPETTSPALEVGAMAFGGRERIRIPIAPLDRKTLMTYARGLKPLGGISDRRGTLFGGGGTTPLDDVFAEVTAELAGLPGRTAIVLISDGEATLPERARHAAQQLLAGSPAGQRCLFTVQASENVRGTAFSQEISALNRCGRSIDASRLQTAAEVDDYTRTLLATVTTPLPPVAAAPPCETRLQLSNVEFALDRADLTSADERAVANFARQLNDCRGARIELGGYADSTGRAEYNVRLSERRAESVRQALTEAGVDASRLSTRGYGASDPVASNDSEAGRARNRRVEFETLD